MSEENENNEIKNTSIENEKVIPTYLKANQEHFQTGIDNSKNIPIIDSQKRTKFTLEDLIKTLQKPSKIRTAQEFNLIQNYLDTTNVSSCLKYENLDEMNIKNVINSMNNLSGYFSETNGKIIIQKNEKIEDYLILLNGKCKIYSENMILTRISYIKFYQRILEYERKGDIASMKINLSTNKHIIKLDLLELDRINHLLFLNEMKYHLYKWRIKVNDIIELLKEHYFKLSDFGLDKKRMEKYENQKRFEELTKYCKSIFDPLFIKKENVSDTKKYKIGSYKNNFILCTTKEEGFVDTNSFLNEFYLKEKFKEEIKNEITSISSDNHSSEEDNEIDNKSIKSKNLKENKNKKFFTNENRRNYSIKEEEENVFVSSITLKCETDCDFLKIKAKEFNNILRSEKHKVTNRELNYLCDNFFFKDLNRKFFEKKYQPKFILRNFFRDEILFNENDPVEKLYFIKEGYVEITIKKNIIDLTKLVKDILKNEPAVKDLLDANVDVKVNTQLKYIMEDLKKIRKISLLKFGSKDMVGIEPIYLGINNFYKATITSRTALIYELDCSSLKILRKDSDQTENGEFYFDSISKEKLSLFVKRSIYLKNIFLTEIEGKLNIEKNKIKLSNLNSKINESSIDSDQNVLNIISEEVISPDKYKEIKNMLVEKSENIIKSIKQKNRIKKDAPLIKIINEETNQQNNNSKNIKRTIFLKGNVGNNDQLSFKKMRNKIIIRDLSLNNIDELTQENYPTYDTMENKIENNKNLSNSFIKIDQEHKMNLPNEINKSFDYERERKKHSEYKKKRSKRHSQRNSIEQNQNNSLFSSTDDNIKSKINSSILKDKAIDFENQTIYQTEKDSFYKSKFKIVSKNAIDLSVNTENSQKKLFNNYKWMKNSKLNYKMDDFFKEGNSIMTNSFDNGSFFITSREEDEKIKWKKETKKIKKNKKEDKNNPLVKLAENFVDDIVPNEIVFTSPDIQSFMLFNDVFKNNKELPLIKKNKFEVEHKKNIEKLVIKKNKKLKIIDEKLIPLFYIEKKVNCSSFKNPNFLGENNDYLFPKKSLKSENIRKFYDDLKDKSLKNLKKKKIIR